MDAMWQKRRDLDMEIMETGVGLLQMLIFLPRISLKLQIPRMRKFIPENGIKIFFLSWSQRFAFLRHYSRVLFLKSVNLCKTKARLLSFMESNVF